MAALDLIAGWPVQAAAAAVVGPSGVLAAHGDTARPFRLASVTKLLVARAAQVAVEEGATVAAGDLIVVLEAMKMEQPLTAHKAGTVTGLNAEVGATVTSGSVLCNIKD